MVELYCATKEQISDLGLMGRFGPVNKLESAEDVATFVETFERVLGDVSSDYIEDVLVDGSGYYLFTISGNVVGSFNFYGLLNSLYVQRQDRLTIDCVNVRYLFPRGKSRGIFNTNMVSEDSYDEDADTGYMDEETLEGIVSGESLCLHFSRMGVDVPITSDGLVIGRSSKQSDYVIHGNGNVSRKHCRVYHDRATGKYFIQNYEPANGTFIDGVRVPYNSVREIQEGNVVMLADEEFRVV